MKKLFAKYISAALFLIIITSCGTTSKVAVCDQPVSKDLIIRWGVVSSQSQMDSFYELNADRTISLGVKESRSSTPKLQEIGKIPLELYCELLKSTRETIMKVQALNVPSDVNNYLEYKDDANNIRFRALWNPNHDNAGNVEFKALYTRYQEAVKAANSK
ncbi:MAG: hypothetical protein A2X64_04540 [Ignavibacteria bacterium GWF2_33_9]|nr:MAG: hypothetical protein A2X64_04540 [Ignavibacteria bacterium GWF2_33_9]